MTALALIRHGPTAFTETRRIQGLCDVPLSGTGCAKVQSYDVPSELIGFAWISSPLSRARETARILCGKPVPTDSRLIEMHWGAWEGRTLKDLRADLGKAMRENEDKGLDFCPDGGESPRQVLRRVQPLLAEIGAARRDTVAVTHRGVIRAIFAAALDWDMVGPPPHKMDWACIHVFDVDDRGAPRISALNIPMAPAERPVPTDNWRTR